jgi:hypothetical protein
MIQAGAIKAWSKGLVNEVTICTLHELKESIAHEVGDLIEEVEKECSKVQVHDWTSPQGRKYRFYIQELDGEGLPLPEVAHPLIKKEFIG